jgi:hypothetical protein
LRLDCVSFNSTRKNTKKRRSQKYILHISFVTEPGIADFSTSLDEGLTDYRAIQITKKLARTYLNNNEISEYIDETYHEHKINIEIFTPDEILAKKEGRILLSPRGKEIKLVKIIEETHPEKFEQLKEFQLKGNPNEAKKLISSLYGRRFTKQVEKKNYDINSLIYHARFPETKRFFFI